MKKFLTVAGLLASVAMAAPASAATITYTYTSVFTGTNNGNPFTIGATFTGVGDTNNTTTIGGVPGIRLSSFTALADGPYTISTPFIFGFNTAQGIVGFGVTGANAFTFESAALIGYNGVSNIAAVTTPFVTNASFATDRGNIVLTGQTAGVFSAVVSVPEPASWAMMIGGVGLVGGALRRRNARVRTTVAFA